VQVQKLSLVIRHEFYFTETPVLESSDEDSPGFQVGGKERRVCFPGWVPGKIGDLGIDEMMGANELELVHVLFSLKELENGNISGVGHDSENWAVWKKMKVKDGPFV
jgi:hypothetical protein